MLGLGPSETLAVEDDLLLDPGQLGDTKVSLHPKSLQDLF